MNACFVAVGILTCSVTFGASAAEKPVTSNPGAAASADDAGVRAVVEGYYRALDNKDLDWIDAHTVADDDAVFIGTDPEEYWVGWKSARPPHEEMLKAMEKTTITVSKLRIKKLAGGSVAVANYLLDVDATTGGKPLSIKNVRATVVLERRRGQWLLASGHASVAASTIQPQ